MAKILVVEDDVELSEVLSEWLKSKGYVAETVSSGEDALQLLNHYGYDLLIFDWELPGVQGINVCEKYRMKGGTTPILFLTGKTDSLSKITGLETGADDYLCKPFEFRELGARIQALLRRPSGLIVEKEITVRGLTLRLDTHKACIGSKEVILRPQEFRLLLFLMRHPGQSFSTKKLLELVWADDKVSDDAVRACMRTLRQKITVEGQECIVKTLATGGYIIDTD